MKLLHDRCQREANFFTHAEDHAVLFFHFVTAALKVEKRTHEDRGISVLSNNSDLMTCLETLNQGPRRETGLGSHTKL